MNDISLMLELQHFWKQVMADEAEINRSKKSISTWENHLKSDKDNLQKKESEYKSLQKKLREKEAALADIESRLKKTEERKDFLKSTREIETNESEIIRLENEKDLIEHEVLELMEKSEAFESKVNLLREKFEESAKQTALDISSLNSKIEKLNDEILKNKNNFNKLSENLSPKVKSRFLKLIESKDGIAITRLNGEICSHCNFQIPSFIATSVLKNASVEICTNCGRFIYN